MKMPRLRVWTLMFGVAFAGLLIHGVRTVSEWLEGRQDELLGTAGAHQGRADEIATWLGLPRVTPLVPPTPFPILGVCPRTEDVQKWVECQRDPGTRRHFMAAWRWHVRMAAKYRLAARRPWLPVMPDPPSADPEKWPDRPPRGPEGGW